MNFRLSSVCMLVTVLGCGVPSDGELLAVTLEADVAAQDLATVNECRCWWSDDGYPSVTACINDQRAGELTDAERACLESALEPYGRFQDYVDCVYEMDRALATCVNDAPCTTGAFNDCYVAFDTDTHCVSPCNGLAGAALTQCNADATAMLNAATGCIK